MSSKSLNNVNNTTKDITISLKKINHKLCNIFNKKNYVINNFLLKIENISSDYIIDVKELKLFNFFLVNLIKTSNNKNIMKFLNINKTIYKKNDDHIILNKKTRDLHEKLKLALSNFFNICIFNSYELSKLLNFDNKTFTQKLFELIQIYYLNNLIDKDNLIIIIRLKIISCLYHEDIKEFNTDFLELKNNTIVNTFSLEVIINFFLSFKNVKMSNKKVTDFINIIDDTMKHIDNLLLNNYNNCFLLSNSLFFYRLIELSQISLDCIVNIIPYLLKVYKFTFKISFCLNDLSEQFLFKKKEDINKKNNNIIAKNNFMFELFKLQNLAALEEKNSIINHGFVFNDNPNNGIILYNYNAFNFPNESFSIVIAFNLMVEKKDKKSAEQNHKKYTLFSLSKRKEDVTDFTIFIENNILKMKLFGSVHDLFNDIEYNKIYVLWHFNSKSISTFYLNDKKVIKQNLLYPKGIYDINLGFENNKKQNNFVGILGTFILFNKCFVKEEGSKVSKFYEKYLLRLKCNYEDIIYIGCKTEYSSMNAETQHILNKLSSDNISRFIEVIISSKSVMSNDFCCCSNKNRKYYKANYFMDKNSSNSMICFNAENIDINLSNYNFNCQNCLITYPIHFNNAFEDFINNNGIKFLELELYYFMGVVDWYSTNKTNNEKDGIFQFEEKEKEDLFDEVQKLGDEKDLLYFKLQYIFNLFLYCLQTLNSTQEKRNKKDIDNFFYTLNNLISLTSKNGFKIDLMFLSSVISHLNLLIEKDIFFDHCGFILEYESYDPNDDKVFELLFQTILIYLDEYKENFLSPKIFSKILDFDKVYLSEKLKDSRKIYSQLIRKYLSLALMNNEECFKIFVKKLKDLKGNKQFQLAENLYNNNIAEEEIQEESESNLKSPKHNRRSDISINKKLEDIIAKEKEKEEKETEKLILMYKSLRNLYLCLDKKNSTTHDIFIILCTDGDEDLIGFFNEEYNYLSNIYDLKGICFDNNYENRNSSDDFNLNLENRDSFNIFEYINKDKTVNKKVIIYSELIKALCIRFIDEITYDENIKNLREELIKKEKTKHNSNASENIKSTTTFFKSVSSFNLYKKEKAPRKGSDSLYLNSSQYSSNRLEDINRYESILMKKFDFYQDFVISPYTFNSFFLLLFRNMAFDAKLKYIKNVSKIFDKLYFTKKYYNEISFFIPIILHIIERVGIEDSNNCFMNKIELLEYVYDRFNSILINMLDNYSEKREEVKHIIKHLFVKKDFVTIFYLNFFDSLKRQKDMTGMIYEINNNKKIDNIDKDNTEIVENLLEKVKKKFYEIIDKTIYELIDPFYIKLLFDIYIKDYSDEKHRDFVLTTIKYIIDKFEEYEKNKLTLAKKYISEKLELNNKSILILIYKIIFYITKRQYLTGDNALVKPIITYLSSFCDKYNLSYLKILFPIDENMDLKQNFNRKIILEMLFEIYIELYLEFKKSNEEQANIFEKLLKDLLIYEPSRKKNNNNFIEISSSDDNDSEKGNSKKMKNYTICYMIDELYTKQSNTKLLTFSSNILTKYLRTSNTNETIFSVTILFLIKISIYIKYLEDLDKNGTLLDFLIKTSELLCKDAQKLQQIYSSNNPLISKSPNHTDLYEEFKNFILKNYLINQTYNKDELLLRISKNYKISRNYTCLVFTKEGKARLLSMKGRINLSDKKKTFFALGEGDSRSRRGSIKDENAPGIFRGSLGRFEKNSYSTHNLWSLEKEGRSGLLFSSKREKIKLINYKILPKFLKFFIRNHFSLYFIKLLTYDEDFINVKKIYNYIYHNEIYNINNYHLDYPSKLKNRLGNIYTKHFLKKDFNFISSQYFQYSHKCIHKRNFIPKTKNLFPSKKILEEYDYAHKDVIINKADKKILTRNCELITYQGTVYGDIYIFQNCILFKSDLSNDKRKINDLLDCACCSLEFDFLEEKKTKIIEYSEVKEVVSRKFLYAWMSLEVIMKNGKSYLFNFFNEDTNNYILDLFKNNNVLVIKNPKEYFDKNEYIKKWKDGRNSTYEHLLDLNKFSSRSYNDANQYPVMPWIFLHDEKIRNFDIPMSIQEEEARNKFLKIPYDTQGKENRWHGNHYSSSAYICYYLMRTNPYTESMIKFQSNNFDVPDRQFFDIKQTLILCEKNNNNREPIPELFTIPEVYLNLNNNDFGKHILNNQGRIHDVECFPYADNAYEFVYKIKFLLNNDEEINTKINLWFDFVFGINQYNKDNIIGKGLRNFNKYCYGQNINIKKIINELKKKQKSDSIIYNEIKSILSMVISFGQCPFQLLTDEHPKRIYTRGVPNPLLTSADKTKLIKDEQELFNETNTVENNDNRTDISPDDSMVQRLYDDTSKKCSIIYFRKSLSKNNLYCLLNSKEIEVYQKDSRYKEYKYKKKINVSKNYLLFKKTQYGYPILKPKYLFCELKEEHFIFCRYLDNSIKLVTPSLESQFLMDSFITAVIRINETDFITGDNKGKLYHWRINYDNILNVKMKLIKKICSNNNSITAILYNENLNIIISADNNSVIIRSFYDFEFLTYIDMSEDEEKEKNNDEIIVDIKVSTYDLVYILINKGNNNYKLKGYSLNGICFGQYEGKITNFELTTGGKVLVGLANMGIVNVLDPINFKVLYSRFIISSEDENDCLFYHFYFEKPNIIFFGFKDKEGSKIKLIVLNNGEIKYFI